MFSFFRKHQRFFYAITALFVATSLISFGTWRTSSKGDEQHSFKSPGKKRHEKKELEALETFLAREASEGNPLNDGILSVDFLKSGLAERLMVHFKERIGGDLIKALPRELRWRPFDHPELPSLSQKMFWRYFCPSLAENYEKYTQFLPTKDPIQLFLAKRDLCLAQSEMPAEQVRRAILDQSSARNIDLHIAPGDLELFGHRDYKEWFGPHFMRLAAQVVILGAEEAEKRGIRVSYQEAKADLIAAAARLQRRYSSARDQALSGDEIAQIYRLCQQLSKLSEKQLIECWRCVLLFRHFASARQYSWSLDSSLPIALDEFAQREKEVTFYTLDDTLQIDTPDKWEQFEIYCRIVGCDQDDCLPEQFNEPAALLKSAPQLLQSPCRASYSVIKKSQLRANFPQRLVTHWLLDEKNWSKVSAHMQKDAPAKTLKERWSAIESLSSQERDQLELLARTALLDQDPQILERALDQPKEETEWMFNGAGLALPLSSVKNTGEFAELVKRAWDHQADATQALLRYEADDDTIISLRLLNSPKWEIAPWHKVLSKGWLKELIKAQRPAKCSAAEMEKTKQRFQNLARQAQMPDAWLNWRALKTMEKALDQLRIGKQIPLMSRRGEDLNFSNQWLLCQKSKQVLRKSFEVEKWPGLFDQSNGEKSWSKPQWNQKPLGFYQITAAHRPFQKNQAIPALDPQLVIGAERARAMIAKQLDQEAINQWIESQIGNLQPLPLSFSDEQGADRD